MGDTGKTIFGAVFVIALFAGAVLLAQYVQDNSHAQEIVASFGYFGVLLISFVSGLNLFVPIPATAFIPIFSAAGFSLVMIISIIVVGTTIADLLSFYIGTIIKKSKRVRKNKVYRTLQKWCEGKPKTTQLVVFLYASFIPLPNEVLLLPLGALGIRLSRLVPAFVLGTILHVTLLAHGLTSLL